MIREPIPRVLEGFKIAGDPGAVDGAYVLFHRGQRLNVIASNGGGWDHVSVSTATRCPTWEEMEYVRSLFFRGSETVMQLSVPRAQHINNHPHCLHLWRPQQCEIPRPPSEFV